MMLLPRELLCPLVTRSMRSWPSVARSCRHVSTSADKNVIDELEQRGMIHELTSRAVRKHVEKPTTVYLGVDPSARSLHVGNLLALIGLLHFRLKGHNGIALIGGATGSVGDPSGRSTERNALSPAELNENVKAITKQVGGFFARGVPFALTRSSRRYTPLDERSGQQVGAIKVENNLDWLGGMGLLDFLSTVGKTARMSMMLSRESVRSRLDSTSGLSFTEFSYQLLQAYDFLTLHKRHGCTIQLGGSDQLGNILSGIEMIRKTDAAVPVSLDIAVGLGGDHEEPAYGVTMPLLTTAAGKKFGKSEGNAIWLDPAMTSPFDFYQFFLRTSDEDALKYLKIFTFVRVVELEGLMEEHAVHPTSRVAQKILAAEATALVHGPLGLRQALAATRVFYGAELDKLNMGETIDALDARPTLSTTAESNIPSVLVRLAKAEIVGQPIDVLVTASGLLASKTQARKAIEGGTLHINGVRVPARSHQRLVEESDLLEGGLVVLRSGKSTHQAVLLQ